MDLKAPIIIVPQEYRIIKTSCCSKQTAIFALDLGHFRIVSDLVNEETKRRISSKKSVGLTTEEIKELELLMFDKFSLDLEDLKVRLPFI
jgi:hypothetical protein